ncbi:MAG: hypothetical protein E7316_02675 [Clostridiales bacterium]|nr:hypothetical protein [Clostridiales bacterium]
MQNYLRKARFSTIADDLGLRLGLFGLGLGWFVYLWGLGIPAVLAGLALGMIGQLALQQFRRRTVDRREAALRRRLGGELMLEEMLLAPARQAHFQAAMLLGMKYPLTMERVTEEGMLCRSGKDRLLVSCVPLPEGDELGRGAVVGVQRACRRHGAARGVVCITGKCTPRVEAWAAESCIPVRIICRETLLHLAGHASPATDEQLIQLGKRRKRPAAASVGRMILRRDKAKTYMLYGLGLMLMYVITRLRYYPVPGMVCLALAVLSRCWPGRNEEL